jgi:hypothetical protein
LTAGNYTISVQDANNCSQSNNTTIGSSATNFSLTTSGNQTICSGDAITISASGVPTGGNYVWNQGIGNGASHSISPNTNTNYTVVATDANGCSISETITITVNTTPSVTISATNATICEGETTTLVATGAQSYTWNTGASGSALTVSPNNTSTYSVIGQNGTCSSASITQTITVNPLPTIVANANNTTVLINESIDFDVTGSNATNYDWDFGDGSTSVLANDSHSYASAGTYVATLTGELNGCTSIDNITIVVDDASSVEEQLSWSVNFYPNPSEGIVNIQLNNIVSPMQLDVFDVQGKLVMIPVLIGSNENIKTIDFSTLNEGVYILSFGNERERINKRITIIR